ncbi:hypothetical protein [Musicola paradisiaca]|uniref:Uncharacterized protein n=1 Tax=Musicola paradisiaca (strain Ech703) TaxID=579405 RepID=C6C4J9_MUSP7|nr:hypothetical protein [Musicola paradisiaca]ACS85573.1 hypothetical protein Dd703_1777 [Musicola paradisiaca Ech703]
MKTYTITEARKNIATVIDTAAPFISSAAGGAGYLAIDQIA